MRVLICGDRNWSRPTVIQTLVHGLLARYGPSTVIIEGEARGADQSARDAGVAVGLAVECYPAKWADFGKRAGAIRNQQMLDEGKPDVVFAFHDDIAASRGTRDMVTRARKAGLPVYVVSRYQP